MVKRTPISKRLRFEVFKRDNFKCQYCGASAPEVILHVDHIKPVKEGGKNAITNLITSCSSCNLGKGARLLDDNTILDKQREQLEELNKKREQLEMMMKWREGLLKIEKDKLRYAQEKFEEAAQCTLTETGVQNLKKLLKKYSYELVLESIEASTTQYLISNKDSDGYTDDSRSKAFNYIGRICAVKTSVNEKPYMKDLFYIRGILKNRLSYCDITKAINLLEQAYLKDASIESLKDVALTARNWSQWRNIMEEYIGDD